MTFVMTLFWVSFAGVAGMLGFQLWKIRSGKLAVSKSILEEPREQISVSQMKKTLWQTARILVHIVILQVIRLWAIITHYVQKKWHKHFGYKSAQELGVEVKKDSFFRSINEYKHRLKKIKQKLKDKEIEKENTLDDQI